MLWLNSVPRAGGVTLCALAGPLRQQLSPSTFKRTKLHTRSWLLVRGRWMLTVARWINKGTVLSGSADVIVAPSVRPVRCPSLLRQDEFFPHRQPRSSWYESGFHLPKYAGCCGGLWDSTPSTPGCLTSNHCRTTGVVPWAGRGSGFLLACEGCAKSKTADARARQRY